VVSGPDLCDDVQHEIREYQTKNGSYDRGGVQSGKVRKAPMPLGQQKHRYSSIISNGPGDCNGLARRSSVLRQILTVEEIEQTSQEHGQLQDSIQQSTSSFKESVGGIVLPVLLDTDEPEKTVLALGDPIGHQVTRIKGLVPKKYRQNQAQCDQPEVEIHASPPGSGYGENSCHESRSAKWRKDDAGGPDIYLPGVLVEEPDVFYKRQAKGGAGNDKKAVKDPRGHV
jgi:hypothetical protein